MADYVTSLSTSFFKIPPAAVPAMLDCIIIASSNNSSSSPSSLLSLLLNAFPSLTQDIICRSEKLDAEECNYIHSFVVAVCHLLKKSGAYRCFAAGSNFADLQHFIWRVLFPLIKSMHTYERETLNKVIYSFLDVVAESNSWRVVEETTVPYFLSLIGLSMGMLESGQSTVYRWSKELEKTQIGRNGDSALIESGSYTLPMSCHILTSILGAALQSNHSIGSSFHVLDVPSVEMFVGNFLWDICDMTIRMLSHGSEHRSCAITFLLPLILEALMSNRAFEISVRGQTYILSRDHFFVRIWKCCKTLFSLGALERRDAYTILSLYLPFLDKKDGCMDDSVTREESFDLRSDMVFWDEMKRGLVDKEGIVRKQSLHILKTTMGISKDNQPSVGGFETISSGLSTVSDDMTKKGRWANKEAKSLGVGKLCNSDSYLNGRQKWGAFFLLYEMLEEYGTHLVEAAWSYQISLLLEIPIPSCDSVNTIPGGLLRGQMETVEEIFDWLAVLWQRAFCHDNPQVRCLIMQSFLGIEWKNYGNSAKLVTKDFLLGSFLQGLNDPVHHKEFGIKGVYSSKTIEGASSFFQQYSSTLSERELIAFLSNLASVVKTDSFGRVGLMSLAECIASAASAVQSCKKHEEEHDEPSPHVTTYNNKAELLDVFRYLIESSKQHFNPNYRLQVSRKVLDAAASVISVDDVPLELLLNFIAALPQEFTDYSGSLRGKIQDWLWSSGIKHSSRTDVQLLERLDDFPRTFVKHCHLVDDVIMFDDEDLEIWDLEAKRWAKVLFLVIKEEYQLDSLLMFIQNRGADLCKQNNDAGMPVKFLILALSVVRELQEMKERTIDIWVKGKIHSKFSLPQIANHLSCIEPSKIIEKFTKTFNLIMGSLVSFSNLSCSVFSSSVLNGDSKLPSSIRGRLGGPSQRRLPTSTTTVILKGITSVKALGCIASWCAQFEHEVSLDSAFNFLWQLSFKIIPCSSCNSEAEAEISLAAFEALTYILKTLLLASPLDLDLLIKYWKGSPLEAEGSPLLDSFLQLFLKNINDVIALGNLTRSRRAILMEWKWICLESLLSIPKNALRTGLHLKTSGFFFSDAVVKWIFSDVVDSLENAGEGSVLPMLRSVRLILELFALGRNGSVVSSCNGMDVQMMWHLVRSSWVLHTSCNKRRVAPIAALLTSVLHYSVFDNECMHEMDSTPGPLKWLVEKVLEEGSKSPRTIRLAALHLTGLWLSNPITIKYYTKELKLLTLYGSVAFDEDFEGEVAENHDARSEVSVMAKSPDPELTQEFINTELYARVSVAVMFNKLADLAYTVGSRDENENSLASLRSGKLFLLELLDFVVNDKDISKELYKKYSAIHRRKIRAWQMICILSRFVDQDIVEKVTYILHLSLYRNNLPGVRQYLETFAIYVYLKFPSLVWEQLVPMLQNYDMRTQALSSYVFIAANVILHAPKDVQSKHLNGLLPPIIPLLTSHHHSLRAFAQLLVYQVLCKLLPALDSGSCGTMSLETKCFVELKSYLNNNTDCARLRTSMEGYIDNFSPKNSISPTGIFSNRVEDVEFECAPTSLLERVIEFLNDVRKDLRSSMAKDAATLKNEQLQINEDPKSIKVSPNPSEREVTTLPNKDLSLDFQKKITFSAKAEKQDADSGFLGNDQTLKSLMNMEKEDQLLDQVLHARALAIEKQREGRQHIILVASLLDRIPNLAGLARTCEVFKAASLAIADVNVVHDKQFQLISVTAEKWVPIIEVPVSNVKVFLEKKKREGFSILGLEQTANSQPLDQYVFPKKTVLVLGREKEGIPVDLIHILDACVEIPQLGVVRSLNVHVSGAIALWEYTRQQRSQ